MVGTKLSPQNWHNRPALDWLLVNEGVYDMDVGVKFFTNVKRSYAVA
jgi:hypothetical protein